MIMKENSFLHSALFKGQAHLKALDMYNVHWQVDADLRL